MSWAWMAPIGTAIVGGVLFACFAARLRKEAAALHYATMELRHLREARQPQRP